MEFARDLAKKHGIMPEEVTSTLVTSLFNAAKAAMVISGPWLRAEIPPGVKYGVAPLPAISALGKPAVPFLTSEALLLSAKSERKKEAFEAMKFFTSEEAGFVMATAAGQTTACVKVYERPEVAKDAVLQAFREQMKTARPMPNTPAMRAVWTPITTAMSKIVNGSTPPADALKAAQAEVTSILKAGK
jgi:maltose-binding protein MalE